MKKTEVAIVGIGCRFPGGIRSPQGFWEFLVQARDGITAVPGDRWDINRYYDADPDTPGRMYTRHGGFLTDPLWEFDAEFFGISPREAQVMDPQQRLLLEVTAEALDDAGLAGRVAGEQVGVYVGGFMSDNQAARHTSGARSQITSHTATSGTHTMLSNRLSHVFDLRGPSLTIDTACSSSLVAFHQAHRAVLSGECSVALVGGVNAMLSPETFVSMSKGRFLAADGRCKTFDAAADGYARGEGAGLLVLKTREAAERDGDRIYAVICGTGVNQDGRTPGITVPNPQSQTALMRQVLGEAGVDPAEVGYIEAHGTGTAVGDPLEMQAIGAALGAVPGRRRDLWVGSVKAAIGHTEAASGVASVIKTVLCLQHAELVPQAWLNELNPAIPFGQYRLQVLTQGQDFPVLGERRLAAVNSFGYGGTNAHALLASAPEPARRPGTAGPVQVFPLSGRTVQGVREIATKWSQALETVKPQALCAAAWTRRAHHPQRIGLPYTDAEDLRRKLDSVAAGEGRVPARTVTATNPTVVFSGMGPQWWGMGRGLLQAEGPFARAAAEVDEAYRSISGVSLIGELLRDEDSSRITRTEFAQPTNFLVQVGLMAELRSLGVQPTRVIGHSVGEVTAAYVSGMLSLQDAVAVAYHRSRLQATLAHTGVMLAVGLSEATAAELIRGREIDVAAVNSPTGVTLAGCSEAIDELALLLEADGVFARKLRVEVPYHSRLMDPILEPLTTDLAGISPRPPELEVWSTVTGQPAADQLWGAAYWAQNVRKPVLFAETLARIVDAGETAFLEVGPHPVLSGNIREILVRSGVSGVAVPTLVRRQDDAESMSTVVTDLYAAGCLDTALATAHAPGADPGVAPHLELPRHRFDRSPLWVQAPSVEREWLGTPDAPPLLGDRTETAAPQWQADLSRAQLPWLPDHVVAGTVLLPATGFVDAALSATLALGAESAVLEAVRVIAPLVIGESEVPVLRTSVEPSTGRFTISSRPATGGEWTVHATGRVLDALAEPVPGVSGVPITAEHISGVDLYARLSARGLEYGPAFRRVQHLELSQDRVVAEVDGSVGSDGHPAHPAVTDAALQCVAALMAQAGGGPLVPSEIRAVRLLAALPARIQVTADRVAGEELQADVVLRDPDGAVVMELLGVRFRPLTPAQPVLAELGPLWYEPVFEAVAERESTSVAEALVALPLHADGLPLAAALNARRPGTHLIDALAGCEGPLSAERVQALLTEPLSHLPADQPVVVAVIAPAAQVAPGQLLPEHGAAEVTALVGALAGVARCLPEASEAGLAVVVVTQNAFALPGDRTGPQLLPAALVGARRVLLNEQPHVRWRLVDTAQQTEDDLDYLARELSADGPDEVALRDGVRLVPVLRRTLPELLELRGLASPVLDQEESFAIEAPGSLAGIRLRRVPRRAPERGEVEVRMESLGLNYKDGLKAIGLLTEVEMEGTYFGTGLGMEGLGVVTRTGPDITEVKVGDRLIVAARGMGRRFATIRLDEGGTVPAPAGWDNAEDFASAVSFLTAHYGLAHAARLRAGETVLIHGGAGGTGRAAIQVARSLGATVIAAAGTPQRRAEVEAAGAHYSVRSRSIGFVEEVLALTGGRGVDVVLNTAPGEVTQQNLTVAAEFGRIVEVGKQGIYTGAVLDLRPFDKNLSFTAIDLDRMMRHRRDLVLQLIGEVSDRFAEGQYRPLPTQVFGLGDLSGAFDAVMRGSTKARVCLDLSTPAPAALPAVPTPGIRPDATYLITGGFGAFGLAIARWLAGQGARSLVLVGRGGATSAAARSTLAYLEDEGVNVAIERTDVTVAGALDAVIRRSSELRGVYHTAGVLQDESFADLTQEGAERVIGTKVAGLEHLHRSLVRAGAELDHLVLFSSTSALTGTVPQFSYAAANSVLDAAAARLRADGWPAVAVDWGAMRGGGMAQSSEEIERYLGLLGLNPIGMDRAGEYLGEVIASGVSQVAVVDVDWAQWARTHPEAARSSRFAGLIAENGGGESGSALRAQLLALEQEQRTQVVSAILTDQVATVLGIPADSIDPATPLPELGMDSLMAVELGARINLALGLEVSALEFSRGGGLHGLAGRFTLRLTGEKA
ncbi:type I polyketide synthase [Kineosporia babensis]|uniref:SDR family NAD(P)-dependent oxidoreductase n=1 Tax=Kineosporia babensis TaxID=499548 RepID=A0A9X1SSE5_9ACTN|nr:SDR family NAD(P)-dependent oxidoreductase [Kineosporia babensis]